MSCGCGGECGCDSIQLPTINGVDGQNGADGADGADGQSAYDIAVANGFVGTETDWLASLVGAAGADGADGTDGISAFSFLTAQFTQPAVGSLVTLTLDNADWVVLGAPIQAGGTPGNWYIVASNPIGNQIIVRNPGAADGYPTGIATNSAPGTVISAGTTVGCRGRDGLAGAAGAAGATGATGTSGTVDVVTAVPVSAPSPGAETAIYYNSGAGTHTLYFWDGAAWQNRGSLNGARGSYIYEVIGNPNTSPPAGAQDGDWAFRTDVANQVSYWLRSAGSWSLITTVTGASTSTLTDVFRVGKLADQPIPIGSTADLIVGFDDWTSAGRYNYGPWDGSKATIPSGAAANQTFILENFRVDRISGAGETIDFQVDIMVNGVSAASDTIALTPADSSGTLLVLTTGSIAVVATDEVHVQVTPSAGPTAQWSIELNGIVFYNQTL